ncbi:MAG: hypothetical protein FGM40_08960 [Rhodocyclaceae bacterium]|nr:hypothetical protein [Rhodocyclaceae bacterium]
MAPAGRAEAFNLIQFATRQLQTTNGLLTGNSRLRFAPGTQEQFEVLAGDVMAAMEPKSIISTPAASGNGFSVALSYDSVETADPELWRLATRDERSEFRVPRLGVRYGWSDMFAVGASVLHLPSSHLTLYSIDASIAAPESFGPIRPGIYASMSRLEGFEDARVRTFSAGATATVRIIDFRVVGGAGLVHGHASYDGRSDFDATINQSRFFGAVVYPFKDFSIGAEFGVIGKRDYQSLGISYHF